MHCFFSVNKERGVHVSNPCLTVYCILIDASYGPARSRLLDSYGWSPFVPIPGQWIQADLGTSYNL